MWGKIRSAFFGSLLDQFAHERRRVGHAFLVRIVEGEARTEDDAALEGQPGVRREAHRILVAAVEEEGGDLFDLAAVENARARPGHFVEVHHRDHHRRLPGPAVAAGRPEDLAPSRRMWASPLARVSPWAIVSVAGKPKQPPSRRSAKARRKKWAERSALPCAPG